MAIQLVPGGAQATLSYVQGGEVTANTLGWGKGTAWTAADCQTLANEIYSWAVADWMPTLPISTILQHVEVKALDVEPFPLRINNNGSAQAGGLNLTSSPNNVTKTILFGAGYASRSARGGLRVPGLTETEVNDNRVDQARLDTLVEALTSLTSASFSTTGARLQIISREHNGDPRPFGVMFLVTSVYVTHNVVGGQSTRLPGR